MDINSTLGPDVNKAVAESSVAASIENSALGSKLGITAEGLGDFAENAMGGTYVSMIGNKRREHIFGVGDPSYPGTKDTLDLIVGDINPFKKKKQYWEYTIEESISKVDKINYQTVYLAKDDKPVDETTALNDQWSNLRDFVNFRFEVLQSDAFTSTQNIVFRALLDGFTDNYTATHNEYKYNGRGEMFYTYNKFNRAMNINFKIAAQSRHEMKPLYQKLNYLVAQTAPNYSSGGRIRTPYMRLTMGDYFKKVPGVLKTCNVSWNVNYPWEIKLDPKNADKDMKVLPHVLDVSIAFQPIHDFTPNNGLSAEFIGIGEDSEGLNSWLLAPRTPSSSDIKDKTDDENADQKDKEKKKQEEENKNKKSYTVKPGDTLSGIASKHGISRWQDIQELNNIQGTLIRVGETLILP